MQKAIVTTRYKLKRDSFNMYQYDTERESRLTHTQVNHILNSLDLGVMEATFSNLIQILEEGKVATPETILVYLYKQRENIREANG